MDDKNSKDSPESKAPQRGSSGPSSTWAKMLLSALTGALVASAVIAGCGGRRGDPRMARGDFDDDMEKPRRITSPVRPPVTKQPLPSKDYILARLKDIGQAVVRDRSHYFITPAELYDVMPTVRIPFSSLLHMVQVLKSLGLQSQIRSVSGREERRWYDLSKFAGDRNVG